jgi:hypothetical protein
MSAAAGPSAPVAASARSTAELTSAVVARAGAALQARCDVALLEGRIAGRQLLHAALGFVVALLLLLAGWLALQAALVLALSTSGLLTAPAASALAAVFNAALAAALVVVARRRWRSAAMPVTRRMLRDLLPKADDDAS